MPSTIELRFLQACRVCDQFGRHCHVSEEASGAGLSGADFVFYISALETDRCHRGMTVAYAAHCQQEAALDRSVTPAGSTVFPVISAGMSILGVPVA